MEKHKLISLALIVCTLFVLNISIAKAEEKEVKVQIHTVQGCGITEAQVRDWIDVANQADKGHARFIVDSNHIYGPNTPYEPNKNDPNRVNIWVRPKCVVTGEPNYVSGQKGNIIEVVPGTPRPSGPNDPNVFIKPSTLAHELNHLLGMEHSNDPNNKMYPDNTTHGGTQPTHSCHRIGIVVTADQFTIIDAAVTKFPNVACERGHGREMYDSIGDVGLPFIDLDWSQVWLEWTSGMYFLNMIAQVREMSFLEFSQIGFYINADNDIATGQPPEGLDYYIAYLPNINDVIFQVYDGAVWLPLDPSPIGYQLTFIEKDLDEPLVPSGVRLNLPVSMMPLAAGNYLSFKTVATNFVESDFIPEAGLATIQYPPQWQPDLVPDGVIDFKDLRVIANNWLDIPTDPNIDLYYDGTINFRDFTELGRVWRQHQN